MTDKPLASSHGASDPARGAVLPPPTVMTLRRRTAAEQRALRLLRGDSADDRHRFLHEGQFARLRELADRNGMKVHDKGTMRLSSDELTLLSWLAQAQRVHGYTRRFHADPVLTLAVVHCAGTLSALGIQLPALSFRSALT